VTRSLRKAEHFTAILVWRSSQRDEAESWMPGSPSYAGCTAIVSVEERELACNVQREGLVQRDKRHKAEGYLLHLHCSCHMHMQGRYPTISLQCLARRRSSVRPGMRMCTAIFSVRQMLPSVDYAQEARCLATCTAVLSVEEATIPLLAFVPGTKRLHCNF
jgi:hypothetical protein